MLFSSKIRQKIETLKDKGRPSLDRPVTCSNGGLFLWGVEESRRINEAVLLDDRSDRLGFAGVTQIWSALRGNHVTGIKNFRMQKMCQSHGARPLRGVRSLRWLKIEILTYLFITPCSHADSNRFKSNYHCLHAITLQGGGKLSEYSV
jgi:hypothetical protein